jgi:hypothetical protein
LENVLKQRGFTNEEHYRSQMIHESDIKALKTEIENYYDQVKVIKSEIATLEHETKGTVFVDIESFEQEQAQLGFK